MSMKNNKPFQIGETVYHRTVYEHKEPLKVVGILEDKLLLEGDFSGGTHNVIQRDWLPIKGTSRIYNHAYKLKCRGTAIAASYLYNSDAMSKIMADMILILTKDVALNPEY